MATTYSDQKSALDALTNSLVFDNATRAITGAGHNAQELGQNSSTFDNLVAYDNYAYKVVRTYATAAQNGQSLKDAYADALTMTPNGAALSATNRAALLIPPGTYSLGTSGLDLTGQFIDLIGLGKAEETIITSVSNTGTGLGTIIQRTNDIIFKNLTIQNTANAFSTGTDQDDSGYAPQNVFPSVRFEDCIFRNPASVGGAPFMRLAFEYSGTFIRCRGIDATGNSVFFPIASGNYFDCHYAGNGFGYNGEASGIFTDSSCVDGFGFDGDATGSFTRCTAFGSGFGSAGNASGTFNYCTALNNSFGWGDGFTCSGTFLQCRGTELCFGNSTSAATFTDCFVGASGFGLHQDPTGGDCEIAGTYTNCVGGDSCFFGQDTIAFTATLSGAFKNCKAGNASFGGYTGGSILTGTFEQCSAGNNSFGQAGCAITDAKFINCTAGDQSFGHGQVIITSTSFKGCKAGNQSFGWSEFPATPSTVFGGEFIDCSGGDECWAWLNPSDGTKFLNCNAGASSFLADTGIPSAPLGNAFYHGCSAGNDSFQGTVAGTITSNCTVDGTGFLNCAGTYVGCYGGSYQLRDGAILTDCHTNGSGFNFNAGGDSYGTFTFTITNCSAGDQSFGYIGDSTISGGTLELAGTFTNCQAGDESFGCTIGVNSSVSFTGKAYNCTAGNFSFCTAVQSPGAGSHIEELSGYLENCHAGPGSFAAHVTSSKPGDLNNCSVRPTPTLAGWRDQGLFGNFGSMINCQWLAPAAGQAALVIESDGKIYGGIYRAGSGAANSIIITSPGTVSIANVLLNAPLGAGITNNITSPNIIVDSDI